MREGPGSGSVPHPSDPMASTSAGAVSVEDVWVEAVLVGPLVVVVDAVEVVDDGAAESPEEPPHAASRPATATNAAVRRTRLRRGLPTGRRVPADRRLEQAAHQRIRLAGPRLQA